MDEFNIMDYIYRKLLFNLVTKTILLIDKLLNFAYFDCEIHLK